MVDRDPLWTLERFEREFDLWLARSVVPVELALVVGSWLMSRSDDPYHGVRRADGFENLWHGIIPDSADGHGRVVVCSYWIFEATRVVRCNSIAQLGTPV